MSEPTHEPAPSEAPVSVVTRFGTAAFGGVVAALLASIPAVLRTSGAGASPASRWIALAAIATPAAVLAVAGLRGARGGTKLVFGGSFDVVAGALSSWTTLELVVLTTFGAVLRKHTHHHGLAGVTFAVFAAVSGLALALFVLRAARRVAEARPGTRRAFAAISSLLAAIVVVSSAVRAARAGGSSVLPALVDFVTLAITCAIASSGVLARRKVLAIVGVPFTVLVFAVGLASLRSNAALGDVLAGGAPIHALLLEALRGSSS